MKVRNKTLRNQVQNGLSQMVGAWERRFATFAAPLVMPQALCFALSCSVFAFHPTLSDVSYAACPQLHARVRSVVCNESDVSPLLCLVMQYITAPWFRVARLSARFAAALCVVFFPPRVGFIRKIRASCIVHCAHFLVAVQVAVLAIQNFAPLN